MSQQKFRRHPERSTGSEGLAILWQFLRRPLETAAVAPSSHHLARHMAVALPLQKARTVVEVGSGTGALTHAIMQRLAADANFLAVERNPTLAALWRQRFPSLAIEEGYAQQLQSICKNRGLQDVDCIVSGLPWPSFSDRQQIEILDAMVAVLRPGGYMATFGYHVGLWMPGGRRFLQSATCRFQQIERLPWEWRNIPPAFVYRCMK